MAICIISLHIIIDVADFTGYSTDSNSCLCSLERRGTGDGLLFHGRGDRGVPYQERGDGGLPNLGRGAGGSFVWGFSRVKGKSGQQY